MNLSLKDHPTAEFYLAVSIYYLNLNIMLPFRKTLAKVASKCATKVRHQLSHAPSYRPSGKLNGREVMARLCHGIVHTIKLTALVLIPRHHLQTSPTTSGWPHHTPRWLLHPDDF